MSMSANSEVVAAGIRDFIVQGNTIYVGIPKDGIEELGYDDPETLAEETTIVQLTRSGTFSTQIPEPTVDKRTTISAD